jgi:hypothetical protein
MINLPRVINFLEEALARQVDIINSLKVKNENVLNPEEANQEREGGRWAASRENLLNYRGLTRKNRKSKKSRKMRKSRNF